MTRIQCNIIRFLLLLLFFLINVSGVVKLVERTVRSESNYSPNRPIFAVGESLEASLAIAVAVKYYYEQ